MLAKVDDLHGTNLAERANSAWIRRNAVGASAAVATPSDARSMIAFRECVFPRLYPVSLLYKRDTDVPEKWRGTTITLLDCPTIWWYVSLSLNPSLSLYKE